MDVSDLTVEVRDKDLNRLGQVLYEDLTLQAAEQFNNVGIWTLTLPYDHPLAPALRAPGGGIIVTGPNDVLFSGPMVDYTSVSSKSDPAGTLTVDGVTDSVVLADMLALPDPTNFNPATQTLSHDTRTGPAETLLHAYVNANIGPLAPSPRRKANLVMGANLARGPLVTKSARFPQIGDLLSEIAVLGQLGFRVVQRGPNLVFETRLIQDRSLDIRLDVYNNTLASQQVKVGAPTATVVIVAGQGDLTARQFYAGTTPESIASEASWGRRIERFVDQRQTNDTTQHVQAANEVLVANGYTQVAVQIEPTDDSTMRFSYEWFMGDRVAIVLFGQEVSAVCSGYKLLVDSTGTRLGVTIGDTSNFHRSEAQRRRLDSTTYRISALERAR